MEGVQQIGDPCEFARKYYEGGIDEIILMDAVASLYSRNHLGEVIRSIGSQIFIPMTVGGGIRSIEDVDNILRSGADKIAINTAVVKNPSMISEVSRIFGSQCMVVQMDAKYRSPGKWELFIEGAREPTGIDVLEWTRKVVELGAGEIFLTSIDSEGLGQGMDYNLINAISKLTENVPVIFSGGVGNINHIIKGFEEGAKDAIALSNLLHIEDISIKDIKAKLLDSKIKVRIN